MIVYTPECMSQHCQYSPVLWICSLCHRTAAELSGPIDCLHLTPTLILGWIWTWLDKWVQLCLLSIECFEGKLIRYFSGHVTEKTLLLQTLFWTVCVLFRDHVQHDATAIMSLLLYEWLCMCSEHFLNISVFFVRLICACCQWIFFHKDLVIYTVGPMKFFRVA